MDMYTKIALFRGLAPDKYSSTAMSCVETSFGLGTMTGPFFGGSYSYLLSVTQECGGQVCSHLIQVQRLRVKISIYTNKK